MSARHRWWWGGVGDTLRLASTSLPPSPPLSGKEILRMYKFLRVKPRPPSYLVKRRFINDAQAEDRFNYSEITWCTIGWTVPKRREEWRPWCENLCMPILIAEWTQMNFYPVASRLKPELFSFLFTSTTTCFFKVSRLLVWFATEFGGLRTLDIVKISF